MDGRSPRSYRVLPTMDPAPASDVTIERFRRARKDDALVVLEGFHPLKHALRFGAGIVEAVSPDPARVAALAGELAPDVAARVRSLVRPVGEETWGAVAPSPPATGVVAIARRPEVSVPDLLADPGPSPVVLLERPSRLGNLGAAIRVAAAADAAAVLALGPHDPWHPEAVRGAAGLQFALPVARVEALPGTDRPIVAIDPEGDPLGSSPLPPRAILAFGSERRGLSRALRERAAERRGIPMRPGVSSLNLATAVAVVLYAGTMPDPCRRASPYATS